MDNQPLDVLLAVAISLGILSLPFLTMYLARKLLRHSKTVPILISALMLLIAYCDMDYDYYMILRLVVCLSFLYFTINFAVKQDFQGLIWTNVGVAILYNPLWPIRLKEETWAILNGITIAIIAYNVYLYRKNWYIKFDKKPLDELTQSEKKIRRRREKNDPVQNT